MSSQNGKKYLEDRGLLTIAQKTISLVMNSASDNGEDIYLAMRDIMRQKWLSKDPAAYMAHSAKQRHLSEERLADAVEEATKDVIDELVLKLVRKEEQLQRTNSQLAEYGRHIVSLCHTVERLQVAAHDRKHEDAAKERSDEDAAKERLDEDAAKGMHL